MATGSRRRIQTPPGAWVAPADGRYLILVRNLIGGPNRDPRRVYRLSVRREEPDFHLAVISRRTDQPAGLNLMAGGREWLEVLAVRRRGLSGPIRVTAEKLPPGIQCPDIWIGPGQDRGIVVLSAEPRLSRVRRRTEPRWPCRPGRHGDQTAGPGRHDDLAGQPTPSGRLTQEIPLATAPEANMLLTASPAEAVVDQESVLDVAVDIEQRFDGPAAPIHLTGSACPGWRAMPSRRSPPARPRGGSAFSSPLRCRPAPTPSPCRPKRLRGSGQSLGVTLVSNPITVNVRPRIVLEIDPRTPQKIGAGKIIQLRYTAERKHGFIGKIHTELAAPGGVVGLRARGVTLVGQTDTGALPGDRHGGRAAGPSSVPSPGGGGNGGGPARLSGQPVCGVGDHGVILAEFDFCGIQPRNQYIMVKVYWRSGEYHE